MEIQMSDIIGIYAAYSKDIKLRTESSSGGIFSLLAEQILQQAGVIYGVAMSQNCQYAEYARIDKGEKLAKLRGSKYLQARLGNTYNKVKNDLEAGLIVLFTGTGCQVNGLKRFLGKEYENLYCVDVICHAKSPITKKESSFLTLACPKNEDMHPSIPCVPIFAYEMFILLIHSSTISFRADTANIEYFIDFNNPIWVNTLCT